MKWYTTILFTTCLFLAHALHAEPPLPEGRRLREIVADKYPAGNVYVGGTTGWAKRSGGSGITMDREFGYVTPENDFKQNTIHPEPGVWHWEPADAWVRRCAEMKQVIRIHGPISPQCSRWALEDNRTPEELKQNLDEYMTALCKRYDRYGHVRWMDVVNETVLHNGKWNGPKPGVKDWENPWPLIGYDNDHPLKPPLYIKLAFQIANRHAPNTKLIINQNGGMQDSIWDKIKAMVFYLREQGLRVDGIGWQAHIDLGWEKKPGNMDRLGALVDWAHANELSFHVTEQNVWLKREKDYEAQAATFAAIFSKLLEKRDSGTVTWNVWNLSDGDAWYKTRAFDGSLFDRQYKPKPAYYALQNVLENPPPPNPSRRK